LNTKHLLRHSLLIAALLAVPLAQAADMTRPDYQSAKSRISTELKSDRAACTPLAANAKDVCIEESKAKEKVARAELEYGYSGSARDKNKVAVAKAESAYKVAKEKCDDMAGNGKDVCVKEAKAVEVKAKADAKMGQQIGEARTDAAQDKRDADYQVATEKCDALAGDAKSACVTAAKARYGKT
jgi:hypothetical protein